MAKTGAARRLPKSATPHKKRFAFISEVTSELKKVSWPSREETQRLFIMVLVVCIIAGAILGTVDYGFSKLTDWTILR